MKQQRDFKAILRSKCGVVLFFKKYKFLIDTCNAMYYIVYSIQYTIYLLIE